MEHPFKSYAWTYVKERDLPKTNSLTSFVKCRLKKQNKTISYPFFHSHCWNARPDGRLDAKSSNLLEYTPFKNHQLISPAPRSGWFILKWILRYGWKSVGNGKTPAAVYNWFPMIWYGRLKQWLFFFFFIKSRRYRLVKFYYFLWIIINLIIIIIFKGVWH